MIRIPPPQPTQVPRQWTVTQGDAPPPSVSLPNVSSEAAMTVRQWVERRYGPEQLPGPKHQSSRRLVNTALNHLQEFFCGRDPRLDEMRRTVLKRWLAWLAFPPEAEEQFMGRRLPTSPQMACPTANKNLGHIMAALNYAVDEEVLRPYHRIRKLKCVEKQKRSWRPREVAAMLAAAVKIRGDYDLIPKWKFWVALILVAYNTGVRISAIMALRWQDYDRESPALFFRGETQKQSADQFLGITAKAAMAVEALRTDGELIFAWPFDQVKKKDRQNWQTLRRHFIKYVLAPAGLPIDCDKPFHRFRRCNATQVQKSGGSAMEQLGHSAQSVTDRYLDLDELGALRNCDRIPDVQVPAQEQQLRLFD